MNESAYRLLAQRLDALPNGFPPTASGAELRLLAKLFTPEEAALASNLRLSLETPAGIAERIGGDAATLAVSLKALAKRGLIRAGRAPSGLEFGLMPFIVGFWESQNSTMDAELARLFEAYYREAFVGIANVQPQVHRVVPVNQTVRTDMEVHPYESAAQIVAGSQAWGVLDCICRKQKALIGEPCGHPLDVCLAISPVAGAFDRLPGIQALTQDEAMATLRRAAEAGLVHTVNNSQEGVRYICNCCTCGCAVLRGIADVGMANVVARSAFVNRVDETACQACGRCVDECQFGALSLEAVAHVDDIRCVGCGVCVLACPEEALALVRRPEAEVLPPPITETDWQAQRAVARGLDLTKVL